MANMDELAEQMKRDELEDLHEQASQGLAKMSVREYAKLKGEQPQLIYYYIRTGKIQEEPCICGRKVIDVASADAFMEERERVRAKRVGGITSSTV